MTTKVIGTSLMILLLVMGALFSGLPIYATTEGGDSSGNESGDEGGGGGSSDEGTESEPETKSEPEPDTIEPTQPETEPQPKTEEPAPAPGDADTCMGGEPGTDGCPPAATDTTELPKCDGTPQDCTTRNGDICKAGEGGEKCECLPDMSDCPNHPSLQNNEPIHPCLLDPSDPVCPKPINGDCPEGYAQNEDGNCFLLHPNGCPRGYHGHEDLETGQCIPNSTPCDPGYEFNKGHTNCERPHFTCDGKPSVVECKDKDKHKDKDGKRNLVIKHFHDTKIINRIIESTDDLDVAQTIVAISYDEGAGINCVISEDNQGQCETFDVTKDPGKEPFLAVIPFS